MHNQFVRANESAGLPSVFYDNFDLKNMRDAEAGNKQPPGDDKCELQKSIPDYVR
jgi:hypothetical protein